MKPVEILLVEDNPGDARLTREALSASKVRNRLHRASDGEEAMAFLRREGSFADVPAPDLILLDLNLPRRDGREVLEDIKNDPALKHIPVVILTSSREEEDLIRGYDLGANSYVRKPVDFAQFVNAVHHLQAYWLVLNEPPPSQG